MILRVDYQSLNSITKPDSFLLSKVEDILGSIKYFSTLDLDKLKNTSCFLVGPTYHQPLQEENHSAL